VPQLDLNSKLVANESGRVCRSLVWGEWSCYILLYSVLNGA
jgi:hypothetical protein